MLKNTHINKKYQSTKVIRGACIRRVINIKATFLEDMRPQGGVGSE